MNVSEVPAVSPEPVPCPRQSGCLGRTLQNPYLLRHCRPDSQFHIRGDQVPGQDLGRGGEGTTFLIATCFSKSQEQALPPCRCPCRWSRPYAVPLPTRGHQALPETAAASRDTPGQGASRGNEPSSSHPPAPASAPFPPPTSKETPTLGPPGLPLSLPLTH